MASSLTPKTLPPLSCYYQVLKGDVILYLAYFQTLVIFLFFSLLPPTFHLSFLHPLPFLFVRICLCRLPFTFLVYFFLLFHAYFPRFSSRSLAHFPSASHIPPPVSSPCSPSFLYSSPFSAYRLHLLLSSSPSCSSSFLLPSHSLPQIIMRFIFPL